MSAKAKTTVALNKELFELVEQESKRRHQTRSAIIEEALRHWQKSRIAQELARGYQAMATEDLNVAEDNLPLMEELL